MTKLQYRDLPKLLRHHYPHLEWLSGHDTPCFTERKESSITFLPCKVYRFNQPRDTLLVTYRTPMRKGRRLLRRLTEAELLRVTREITYTMRVDYTTHMKRLVLKLDKERRSYYFQGS